MRMTPNLAPGLDSALVSPLVTLARVTTMPTADHLAPKTGVKDRAEVHAVGVGDLPPVAQRLLVGADHPHRVVLRCAAVSVSDGRLGAVDLMVAGQAHDLKRRLPETDHAGGTDRVRRQHATGAVDREIAAIDRRGASSTILQPCPFSANPSDSSHIGSYQENGTYISTASISLRRSLDARLGEDIVGTGL